MTQRLQARHIKYFVRYEGDTVPVVTYTQAEKGCLGLQSSIGMHFEAYS